MLRLSQRSYQQGAKVGRRGFSKNHLRLNEIKSTTPLPPTPVETVKPKKNHPFRKLFIRVGVLTSIVYLGGIALSLKNDAVYDNFVDFFPFGEELVEFTENYFIGYGTNGGVTSARHGELTSFNDILDKTVKVTKSGITSTKIDESELQKLEESKESILKNASGISGVTDLGLPLIEFKTGNDRLEKIIDNVNDFIRAINSKKPVHVSLISEISNTVKELNQKLESIEANKQTSIGELATQEQDVQLTKAYVQQLDLEKELLEKKFNEILIKEIEATKNKIFLQADNKIDSLRLQQLNEFNKVIQEKIDNERNGKLAKLDQIYEKIEKLEQFEIELSEQLSSFQILKKLKVELAKLTATLQDSSKPIILNGVFDNLQQLLKELNDEILIESVKQLPKDGNLLTQQQIISRWRLLTPELKAASLLPPNAGILGHFASRFFSKFLFSKEGFAEGNDIESIIARVNGHLERGELDSAVEEVTSLKGWTRKLADDWVIESRKRLEVEFLVKLIEYEARLAA